MAFLTYLHFFALITFLYLAVYIFLKAPKEPLNRIYTLYILSFAVWCFGKIFVHNPASSRETANFFENIASIGWISFVFFFLWVVVVLTEKKRIYTSKFFPLTAIPVAVLLYKQWTGFLLSDHVRQQWGWANQWSDSVWPYLFYLYYLSFMLCGLFFLGQSWKGEKDPGKRKQDGIIFITASIILVLGTLTDIVLPEMNVRVIPEIADIFILFWAFELTYIIARYKFLSITPATAAENIISTMSDSLMLLDHEGKITAVNQATCGLLGREEKELKGKSISEIFSAHSIGKLDITSKGFVELIEEDEIRNRELSYMSKNGERVPVLFSASVLRDKEGRLQGIVAVAKDVTEMKKSEEESKRMNEQLMHNERAVINILEDLRKSHEDLKASQEQLVHSAKMASLGKLVADMAHEVNNPLQIILGRAQIALMDEGEKEEVRNALGIVVDQCHRAKSIIERLLVFSKPSTGALTEIGINDSLEFVIKLVEHQFSLYKVNIIRNYCPENCKVRVDEKQIHEVYMNLLKNAVDAMPEGGTITISTSKEGNKVRADITDTGTGISEEDMKKIFEPFYTTRASGTGLGLSVCYGIIQAHGGELKYHSELGKGATATVLLPG